MKNLINFFFSFDKLFKEKLIVPFFWLAIIYFGLKYFGEMIDTVQLDPFLWIINPLNWFVKILFTLIIIRIVSELIVGIFRINDNLSPDKGLSELADIDPMAEARKAAESAAARTREATKTVSEKASAATKSLRENVDDMAETVQSKAKSVTQSSKEKVESVLDKTSAVEPKATPKPSTPAKTVAADVPKKRGRPKGSTNKPKTTTSTTKAKTSQAKTTSAPKKRGPKPGRKVPRDADGNLLKKDGTPRKKPGPKSNS